MNRDLVPIHVSELLDGKPTRWAPTERLVGDYNGRERTLEVFDAKAGDQRRLLRQIGTLRREIEEEIGGSLIVIFHTPSETERLYSTQHEGEAGNASNGPGLIGLCPKACMEKTRMAEKVITLCDRCGKNDKEDGHASPWLCIEAKWNTYTIGHGLHRHKRSMVLCRECRKAFWKTMGGLIKS